MIARTVAAGLPWRPTTALLTAGKSLVNFESNTKREMINGSFEDGNLSAEAPEISDLLSKMKTMIKAVDDHEESAEADAASLLQSLLHNNSDARRDSSDVKGTLLKLQALAKRLAEEGEPIEADAATMLQSLAGKAADSNDGDSDITTLMQKMQSLLQTINNNSDTGDAS